MTLLSINYKITSRNGVQYLSLQELEYPCIRHFFTTKNSNGRNSIPFDNNEIFVTGKQVHGDNILIIDKPADNINTFIKDSKKRPCDAIITDQMNIGIGVVTADCLPVLLYDPVQSVISAVHVGWRGTINEILSKAVDQMVSIFSCREENIIAGMGPAIGSCCYTVGEVVIEALMNANPDWEKYLTHLENGKAKLNLSALNIRQIEDAGIPAKNIFSIGLCTACNKDLFYSYRRDGIGTGRMISGIMMSNE